MRCTASIGGREVRIAAAPGGVDVEPLDGETRAGVEKLLGLEFELEPFTAWAAEQPVLSEIVAALPGFRPPLAPDPFESLVTSITAQQVSLIAAFAIRSRFIERLGVQAGEAYAFPTRARVAGSDEAELVELGFSRRKAEYVIGLARDDLDLEGLHLLRRRRGPRAPRRGARARALDGRMVPRPPPRASARLAGR